MAAIRNVIVGTAGHIDHGKSTLVKALTGIDPDRLREEQERGMTIDLGFAPLTLPGGAQVGIVDVPGHERFIKNMVAGATRHRPGRCSSSPPTTASCRRPASTSRSCRCSACSAGSSC